VPPDAEYTFKHALVQDAAYGTLLRSRRKELHARIAATLESRFPDIVAAQPALLALHCDEAGLTERAVAYCLAAGRQAWARSAATETVALLRRGLAMVPVLPETDRRRETELDLRIALGQALVVNLTGATKVGAPKPTISSRLFTAGSPKASTRQSCKTPRRCSTSCGNLRQPDASLQERRQQPGRDRCGRHPGNSFGGKHLLALLRPSVSVD
jgi:hypothetical protein